ncbi:MAG: type IV pilus modification PilV family protein [Solirubrobacteraceae bacterium]
MIRILLARSPTSERGDTLIEVLIGSLLLVVIVSGVVFGLNSANQATSLDRQRSQATALAQQEEEQLRSEPIAKLSEMSRTEEPQLHEVDAAGTTFLITSTAHYVADAAATSSCAATNAEASYIETSSKVTWAALASSKPVVQTGVIAPPPGSDLIVAVDNQAAEPLEGASVTATGKTAGTTSMQSTTSADGCAVLAVSPGEYSVNVSKLGYVDGAGYTNSVEDPQYSNNTYVVAETSVKLSYQLGKAATVNVAYEDPSTKGTVSGEGFVLAHASMTPSVRCFGATGCRSAATSTTGKTVFPFTSGYEVYAGSCEADNPHTVDPSINPGLQVQPGQEAQATVGEPPISIRAMSGVSSSNAGQAISGARVTLTDGCGVKHETETNAGGEISYPAPYGTYAMCVSALVNGESRAYTAESFANDTPSGPGNVTALSDVGEASNNSAIVYLGQGTTVTPGHGTLVGGKACP